MHNKRHVSTGNRTFRGHFPNLVIAANSKVDRPTDHCAHCLHTTSSSAAATFLRRSDTLQRLKRMCVSRKTNTAGHILWTQEVAGGCQHDPKALFACIPASVKPGPAPPPPPPSHTKRKHAPCKPASVKLGLRFLLWFPNRPPGNSRTDCIPTNISAGWAGYPQNVGGDCGWAAIQSQDGGWANATVSAAVSTTHTTCLLYAVSC